MTREATENQLRRLADRADCAGYRLIRDHTRQPETWLLIDGEDGTRVHSAPSLDRIEAWLNE
ncbi:hypothetical protein NONO_c02640 [Nocardia nova SH22a]|uniref:Uncharacterized protein n=1 Tax=Nocardia nova SH22a TaxID=1415166 RepID=W5T7F3_9NOCA|nr:hypothetical protein [Nocardia nova]AHH15079.1 hypothetical protein NONO_c02640 [Nocardia nova SH22a]